MKIKINVKKILIIIFWLIVWEILDKLINNRIVLVGPINILESLIKQMMNSDFWIITIASFTRITIGFFLSFIVGIVLAMTCYRYKLIQDFLEPVMNTIKTIPMASFVIMLLIWVGNQALTIWLAFLIVLPLIYTNVIEGLNQVDKEMLEMAEKFKLTPWKKYLYIYRPVVMPFLLSATKTSLGLSWKSGIMAEVMATPKPSIGREMFAAKTYLQTSNLLAWTIVVIVLSIVFEKVLMKFLERINSPAGSLLVKNCEEINND